MLADCNVIPKHRKIKKEKEKKSKNTKNTSPGRESNILSHTMFVIMNKSDAISIYSVSSFGPAVLELERRSAQCMVLAESCHCSFKIKVSGAKRVSLSAEDVTDTIFAAYSLV